MATEMSSLRGLATRQIIREIQSGRFQPGTIVTEVQICEIVGLNRTPVREALIELVANGVIEKVPHKGYQVREFDEKSKIDVFEIIAVLDALAARLSIEKMTDEDFMRMNELIDLMNVAIKYQNYEGYNDLQEQFHHVYIDKCDNPFLINKLEEIKESVPRYTYYSDDNEKMWQACEQANEEHKVIVELIRKKEALEVSRYLIYTHWFAKSKYKDII
jgi:Transcriptional regulators